MQVELLRVRGGWERLDTNEEYCIVYLGVGPTVTATVAPFGIIAGPLGDLTLDLNSLNE